ncbi:MAG: hypothetical protein ABIF82_07135 [Planctomycetota bacterium]
MAKLKMEVSAEEGQMLGAFRNMSEGQKRFVQGNRQMGRSGSDMTKSIIAGLGSVLASYLSINGAIRAGTALIEDRMRKEREAAQAHGTLAQERAGALYNLPRGISQEQLTGFIAATARPDVGVTQAALWGAAKTGLSAKGGLGWEPWKSAMTEAARISAMTGEEFDVMAGAAIDLAKVTGQTGAAANLGWMRQIGVASRVTTLAGQAGNIPRAMVAAKAFGEQPEQAAEMWAAISQMLADPEGRDTTTGMIRILQVAKTGKVLPDRRGKFGMLPEAAGSFAERLKLLQTAYAGATPETRGEMLTKFGGRGAIKGVVAAMLEGRGAWEQYLAPAREEIGAPSALSAAELQAFYAQVGRGPSERVARVGRAGGVLTERLRLADEEGAVAASLYEQLFGGGEAGGKGILGASDLPWAIRKTEQAKWQIGRAFGRTGEDMLQGLLEMAEIRERIRPTEGDVELLKALRELANSLKENIGDRGQDE